MSYINMYGNEETQDDFAKPNISARQQSQVTGEGKSAEDVWEWVALFYGALNELVQLKQNKEQEGETPDYLERKPKAWYLAKEVIRLWALSDYGTKTLASQFKDAGDRGWISVDDKLPEASKDDEDNSDNVLAICDGRLMVMAYCYIDGTGAEDSGWCWCSCNGDIHGDPEFDDDYKITHWMPLPKPPSSNKNDKQ